MSSPAFKVLFLCRGNSARSIFAESILNHLGAGHFVAYSAGSAPSGQIHPLALQVLKEARLPTAELRSKSWDEYAAADAPQFDFIFTVCDNVAGETCPIWAGHTMSAHWGIADPVAVDGTEDHKLGVFRTVYLELDTRIRTFINLPLRTLDRMKIQEHLDAIGAGQTCEARTSARA
jgi:protein-tyrosine-phosphatase